MTGKATLYYIYDPMCSWCWGFKPVWEQVKAEISWRVDVVYVLGGLAPESHEPMEEGMRESLQQTWRRVSEICGVEFNFDFWTRNTPMRSTYPACKAAMVAREYGKELAMYERIQAFYYREAGNPSVYENLYNLAQELDIPREAFIERIHSSEVDDQLQREILFAEQLGAQGFPSLILKLGDVTHYLQPNYTDVNENIRNIDDLLGQDDTI